MATGDRYVTKTYCLNATQVSITTFNWLCQSSTAPGILQSDIASAVDAMLAPLMKPILYSGATYRGTTAQKVIAIPFLPSATIVNSGPGTSGATALPAQSCGITTWQSVLAGRSYRGRTYWPFPSTLADNGDGYPIAAYVSLLRALSIAILAGFTVTDGLATEFYVPYVRHSNGTQGPQIVTARNNVKWATQRRRGDYGRQNVSPI